MPTPLQLVADKYVNRFAAVFEQSANALTAKVKLADIEADMARGIKAHPKSLYALVDAMPLAKKAEATRPAPIYTELIASAGSLGGVVLDLDSPFVLDAAKKLTADLVTNVNAETKKAIRQMIFEAIRDGDAPVVAQKQIREIIGLTKRDAMLVKRVGIEHPERVTRLRAQLVRRRAITIARTETMTASNRGQQAAWRQMMSDGLLDPATFRQKWIVTDDDRLCFPAGTLVSTARGDVPIEDVAVGEVVCTPGGHFPVTATMARDYSGLCAYWESSDGGWSVATSNHPIWTDRGWCDSGTLRVGDLVDRGGNDLVEIARVHRFFLRDLQDVPPARENLAVAARIAGRVGVPVGAVHFHGERVRGQSKIYGDEWHPVTVYDLQVTGPACFYADGFLVHNCELCAPMDGLTVGLDEDFESTEKGVLPSARVPYEGMTTESPALHPSCRCTISGDFGD